MTCEMLETIEKHPDGDKAGVMISTGGASLPNDFAALVAFALNITCTLDPDLTRRLLATKQLAEELAKSDPEAPRMSPKAIYNNAELRRLWHRMVPKII